jgi:hypothetical protein
LKPLDAEQVLPGPDVESGRTDIVGLFRRIAAARAPQPQYVVILSDLADTQYRELPLIPAPEGENHVLVLLVPAERKDAQMTLGKALFGCEQFEVRRRQMAEAPLWAVAARYFARKLAGLLESVPARQADGSVRAAK